MGTSFKRALSLASSSVCLLVLAACGGGGGGTAPATTTPTTPAAPTTPTTPTVSIGAPDLPRVSIQAAPAFDFTTNPPAIGRTLGVGGPAVKITATSVSAAGTDTTSTAIYRGTVTSNGTNYPVFDLTIPTLSLTASNVRGDGTPVTLPDGGKVAASVGTLNYTLLGAWTYTPAAGGSSYLGTVATGSGTATANVPTTGTATYNGSGTTGGVVGAYFVPSGTGSISTGTLGGKATVNANFATGAVTGTLSNMTATPAAGGAATPWNDVSLSANISRFSTGVAFNGSTSTSGAPANAGAAGFSSAATGVTSGGFFGPNAEEIGAAWSLTEPSATGGGKTAFGAFAATK